MNNHRFHTACHRLSQQLVAMAQQRSSPPKFQEEGSDIENGPLISKTTVDNNNSDVAAKPTESSKTALAILAYCFCSASLLVVNKVAVVGIPSPSFVLVMQFVASVVVCLVLDALGVITVEKLEISRIKPFMGISILFCICLFTNVKSLQYANVETVIVFRACSPIAVALCDVYFLNQPMPSQRSWMALGTIVLGAFIYVASDSGFEVEAYFWVIMYFVSIVTEMVYVKMVVDSVPMSTWGRVYYNNVLSIPLTIMLGIMFGDHHVLMAHTWDFAQMYAVGLSCVVGVGISYAGFNLRALVSATSFTVVGVLNKLASVLLNVMLWDKHANGMGIFGLVVCIAAGTMYQQTKGKK